MSDNYVMAYNPTLRERIGHKLFPSKMPEFPQEQSNKHYRDELVQRIYVNFSFIDRIRLLVSGKVRIESRTATENVIGYLTTAVTSMVEPPNLLTRRVNK